MVDAIAPLWEPPYAPYWLMPMPCPKPRPLKAMLVAEPIVRSLTPDPPAAALVEADSTSVHGLSAAFDTECRTMTRTW